MTTEKYKVMVRRDPLKTWCREQEHGHQELAIGHAVMLLVAEAHPQSKVLYCAVRVERASDGVMVFHGSMGRTSNGIGGGA